MFAYTPSYDLIKQCELYKRTTIWQKENQEIQQKQDPRKLQLEGREVRKAAVHRLQVKEGEPAEKKRLPVLPNLVL
jgi:hypothetical protein